MSCESSIADLTMDMFEDDCRDQLLSHIKELQEAVSAMKSAFTAAQVQLESVQGEDHSLREEMDSTKTQCQQQSAEILRLMLSLKSEVSSIKEMMQTTQMMQHGLQSTVQSLILERDFLLDELAKTGAISETVRGRLHSRLSGFGRPSSGSQTTNDSGVALLLEKAHAVFQPHTHNGVSNHHHPFGNGLLFGSGGGSAGGSGSGGSGGFRDQDSLPDRDHQSHIVAPHVHDYLNALNPSHHHHHLLNHNHNNNGEPSGYSSFNTENGPGAVYDSDSSLTLAATKSLSLSNSLSKQCGLELDQEDEKNRARHESGPDIPVKGLIQNAMLRAANGPSSYNSQSDGEMATDNNGQMSFKESQRLKVAREMVETERKYCHTLRTIQDTFAQPLKSSGILTMKDINTLFPEEVFDLYEKHCGLLAQLEERISSWKSQPTIGDLLERFTNVDGSDVLRLYTSYVNDFPEVLKTFHKLCRSCGEFTRFLKSCLEHPTCGGLDLGAFLLTPVQRMPRYILLLKQMIKYTDVSHPDYKDITICLNRLRDYLKRLNDSMEHSFQLVTAQITPQPHSHHENIDKMVGFSGKNSFPRASISSHSSTGEEIVHKVRYKRSTSVPRNQVDVSSKDTTKGKLKSRSKSDWTVCSSDGKRCQTCSCSGQSSGNVNNNKSSRYNSCKNKAFERAMSDSDINSDVEEGSLEEKEGRKFPTSKSLHDFNQAEEPHQSNLDWTISEPSLCDGKLLSLQRQNGSTISTECNNGTTVRNNILLRPLTTAQPGRYVARIQRGSEPELNLCSVNEGDNKDRERTKKRTSIRTSLKNIFSMKKRSNFEPSRRSSRTLHISHPIPPSMSTTAPLPTSGFCKDAIRSLPEPVVMTHYEPATSSSCSRASGTKFSSSKGPQLTMTKYGVHYVDEEGKPCTNV